MEEAKAYHKLYEDGCKLRDKARKSWNPFVDKADLFEKSVEKFQEAANLARSKMDNAFAGKCYEAAADVQTNDLSEFMQAAANHGEASRVYKKEQPEKAEKYLILAIKYHVSKGTQGLSGAARLQKELAEFYEMEVGDQKKALEAYKTAGQWYESSGSKNIANGLYLKMADLAALEGDYQTAISKLEEVAKSSINNGSLRFSVNDYFMRAGICHLASGDLVATKRALQSYSDMDSGFTNPRERLLLNDLCQFVEEGDEVKFSDRLLKYDQLGRIDSWKTTMLLRVKDNIEKQEEDFS